MDNTLLIRTILVGFCFQHVDFIKRHFEFRILLGTLEAFPNVLKLTPLNAITGYNLYYILTKCKSIRRCLFLSAQI